MKNKLFIVPGALVAIGAIAAWAIYAYWDQEVPVVGMGINYFRSWSAPSGTTTTELAAPLKDAGPIEQPPPATAPDAISGDWSSYNKTLTSERYSRLSQINTRNATKLKILCTYDTEQHTSFETGLIMVNGALIGTTEHDIFSLNPANLPRELAHAGGLQTREPSGGQSRRRLPGRPAISRHRGRAGAGL